MKINNIYEIRNDWEKQTEDVRKGIGEKDKIEDLFFRFFDLKELIPKEISLYKEIDLLRRDRIIYSDCKTGYVSRGEAIRLEKFLNFINKLIKKLKIHPIKIYFDTNIISRTKDFRIKKKDARALGVISNMNNIELFTSKKTKREIEECEDESQKGMMIFVYNLIKKIPEEKLLKEISSSVGVASIGVCSIGGGFCVSEDNLFKKIKEIFDENDAEHIFQAIKNDLDYFITLDKKSILNRISGNKNELEKISNDMKFLSPSDFIKENEYN